MAAGKYPRIEECQTTGSTSDDVGATVVAVATIRVAGPGGSPVP
jgi:hypothetical protein